MERWPPRRRGEEGDGGDEEEAEPALLVALHACGDLTPDAIEAFIAADDAVNVGGEEARPRRESQRRRRAIFVGCCYNLMTPSLFPLSSTLSSLLSSASLPPSPLTRAHLRLTPQSPLTWHLTPLSTSSFLSSTLKIAFRARFEAELEAAGVGKEDERRVGRIPECKEWEGYREKARGRYEYADAEGREGLTEGECEALGFEGEEVGRWERALWRLRVFWTLRSWVGPAVESLCVVDRFAYCALFPSRRFLSRVADFSFLLPCHSRLSSLLTASPLPPPLTVTPALTTLPSSGRGTGTVTARVGRRRLTESAGRGGECV